VTRERGRERERMKVDGNKIQELEYKIGSRSASLRHIRF